MSKKQPKVIQSTRFGGTDPLSANDLKRLTVNSFSQAGNLVEDWAGEPMLIPGLVLTQDNSRVESATPVLIGTLFNRKPLIVDCAKHWNFEQKLRLKFKALDLRDVPFGTNMTSNLMDCIDIPYDFINSKDERVDDTDLVEDGLEGFCIRIHLCPASTRTAKMEIMFFPLEKEKLLAAYPLAKVHVFPGMEIFRVEIELGIQRDELLDNNYGLPILPAIITREPIKSSTVVPSREEVVTAISSLLRRTTATCVKSTSNSMYRAWSAIKKGGESKLADTVCRDEWPLPPEPQNPQGT